MLNSTYVRVGRNDTIRTNSRVVYTCTQRQILVVLAIALLSSIVILSVSLVLVFSKKEDTVPSQVYTVLTNKSLSNDDEDGELYSVVSSIVTSNRPTLLSSPTASPSTRPATVGGMKHAGDSIVKPADPPAVKASAFSVPTVTFFVNFAVPSADPTAKSGKPTTEPSTRQSTVPSVNPTSNPAPEPSTMSTSLLTRVPHLNLNSPHAEIFYPGPSASPVTSTAPTSLATTVPPLHQKSPHAELFYPGPSASSLALSNPLLHISSVMPSVSLNCTGVPSIKPTGNSPSIKPSPSASPLPALEPPLNQSLHSQLVYPGSDSRLIYVEHNNKKEDQKVNTIPDFSYCGYKGGGVAIPTVGTTVGNGTVNDQIPIKITLVPQPNGTDRASIQNAINYVSSFPPDEHGFRGAVLLKAGVYHVDDGLAVGGIALLLNVSGVVLRGEGQGGRGYNASSSSSTTTVLRTSVEFKHEILRIDNRKTRLRYRETNYTQVSDEYVGTGAMQFTVENATLFSVGEVVHVKFTPNELWLSDIHANTYMKNDSIHWTTTDYRINYERTITNIVGSTLHIHSPLVQPMQIKYGGGQVHKLVKRRGQRLSHIGIENLRLEGPGVTPTLSSTNKNRLVDAIMIQYAENCWVRNVTSVHVSNSAVQIYRSQYVTVEDSAYITPYGPINGGFRYSFYIQRNSTHNLVQRTFAENGRHDYVTGPMTPGANVFLDGYANLAWSDSGPHQRWATGTLYDSIKVTNHPHDIDDSALAVEHRGGGGSGHGWAGAQFVFWNTESPVVVCDTPLGHKSYAIGVIGREALSEKVDRTEPGVYRGYYDSLGSHVALRSLYLAQLEDRLGREAVNAVSTESQRNGFIWEELYERYHVD